MENKVKEKPLCKDCVYFSRQANSHKLLEYKHHGYCAYRVGRVKRELLQTACHFFELKEPETEKISRDEFRETLAGILNKLDEILRVLKSGE